MIETLAFVLTGIGLAASIVYYANILNNANKTRELQLKAQQHAEETRQAQLFMNIYNQGLNNQRFQDAQKIMITWKWTNFEELWNTFFESDDAETNMDALWVISGYYEGVGVLVKEDLLHIRYVANLMTHWVTSFWELFEPYIGELRVRMYPRLFSETEYLYNELVKYIKEHPEITT